MLLDLLVAATVAATSVPPVAGAVASFTHAAGVAEAGPRVLGLVVDSAGRPLASVQVIVGGLGRTTTTDDAGRFVLVGLPVGKYHVDALLIGYARGDATVVVPSQGADVELRIVLLGSTVRLSGVQVTASPLGADPLDITQSTIEMSGAELQRSLGASVAQTLAREPGMSVRFNGPAASTPVIRGLSGERILVLQDGDRAADLSSTAADHGLTVDPNAAQRIEVVRGPASLLYGSSALGGVVNVITNDIPTTVPQHLEGFSSMQSEGATPGTAVSFGLTAPVGGAWAVSARVGVRNTQDQAVGGGATLANTFNRTGNTLLSTGYSSDHFHAGVALKLYDFNYGLPSPVGDPEAGRQIRGNRQELRFRGDRGFDGSWLSYLRVDVSLQAYAHDEIENSGVIATRFRLSTQTLNLTGKTRFAGLEGAIGVQGLFRQYESLGSEALTQPVNTSGIGLFVYQERPLTDGKLPIKLQAGARVDFVTIASVDAAATFGPGRTTNLNNFSGSLGLSWPLAEGISLGASIARAFRAPSVEELYSRAYHAASGSFDIGDQSLRPETNLGVDGVLRVQRGGLDAQVAAYTSTIENFVVPNFTGDTLLGLLPDTNRVPINRFRQARANMWGVEGRVEGEVRRHLVLGVMADLVRGEFAAGGGFLPFLPPPRAGLLARWDDRRWMLGGDVRYAHRQGRVTGGDDIPTEAFTLLNLQASYTFGTGGLVQSISLRADNLTDVAYRDSASRIKAFSFSPGRNISMAYRVLF